LGKYLQEVVGKSATELEKLFTKIVLEGDISRLRSIEDMNIYDYFVTLNDAVIIQNKKNKEIMKRGRTSNSRVRR
jgi:hypothetical protein